MVPDYYTMLGIESGADRAAVEAALARCQPAWSSGTRNPKNKHTFQSYLDQIPALRQALLGDPTARAAYDAELAAGRRAERDRKLDELQGLLRLRAAKGGLTVSDRTILRAEAVRLGLTHDDLDRMAELVPARPEAPADEDAPDPPQDVIDPAMRRQIRIALEHLRRRDLYDVLGVPRDAPAAEIQAQADAERQRWMQKTQVTAEKTAWLEAVSYAQSHLGSAEPRARYDRTLVFEAEDYYLTRVDFSIKGMTRLDHGTHAVLLDEAAALGIVSDRADRLIRRRCRVAGVAPNGGSTSDPQEATPRLLRCRSCGGVSVLGQKYRGVQAGACPHCRASLRWDCPTCQRNHWVDESRCGKCGFPLAHLEPLVRHFEAAQYAHKARDDASALAHLERVQHYAPHHAGARKAMEKVRERLAEIDRARAALDLERVRHHLVGARAAVETWARLVRPDTPEVQAARDEIQRGLREALSMAAQGRELLDSDPRRARSLFRQGLALAADLPEAREGLRRCPPDPPADLRAEYDGTRVSLRWSASPPDGLGTCTYRVVRKRNGLPAHAADGTLVAEGPATEAEDSAVSAGEVVGYAVFSLRGEVHSTSAAAIGPAPMLGDVTDVRVETRSREVQLSWVAPPGALGVSVVRKTGSAPSGPNDGEPVETLREHAFDRVLRDDRVYHYALYATYRGPNGQLLCSRGVTVSAMPHTPLRAIGGLVLRPETDGRVQITWEEPERGQVKILRSPKPIALAAGTRLAPAEAKALEGQWLEVTESDRAIDGRPPLLGVCYYTPFTSWAGSLIAGKGAVFSCVPDPADLRAVRVGGVGKVHLRWRWSPQSGQSLLVAKAGSYPARHDDPDALRFVVKEDEYGRTGFYALTLPPSPAGPWHLCVYSLVTIEREAVVSPGLEPTARTVVPGPHPEVTVSYHLRPPRFPGRSWHLTFRTEPPGAPIPAMALVAHPRTVPLTVDDGQVVDQFPASRDGAAFRIRSKTNLARCRARVFVDPRSDPTAQVPIRLRHPEAGGTRV
jgi:hypothetical protein